MTPRLAALLLALILPLAARADDGGWKRIPCVQSDALDVTLLLRRSATPAVPRFVGWELRNKTGRPMIVDNALYRLAEVEVFPVGGGRQWRRTGIIQSNPHDLLLREGPPPEVGHRPWTLPPGVTRRLAYASAYGHYSLSDLLPAGAGLVGRAHFGLTTRDADFNATGRYATPPKGVTFVFEYLPPDAAGVASMRRELAVLLAASPEGVDDVVYAHDLRRLLGRREVADAATVDVLLDAIESERSDHASRGVIVEHLNAHHADDPATIARYARGVADRGTSDWLRDLAGPASGVTHADLIGPLVARAEDPRHSSEVGVTLGVLARHRPLADDPAALARRLGRIALSAAPRAFRDGTRWDKRAAEALVHAGDPATAAALVPFLEDEAVRYSPQKVAVIGRASNMLPIRVKDEAANAALDLLGDDRTPRASAYVWVEDEPAELARRDAVAAELRNRLRRGK